MLIPWYRSSLFGAAEIKSLVELISLPCIATKLGTGFVDAFELAWDDLMSPWPHMPPGNKEERDRSGWIDEVSQQWFRSYWCEGDAGYYERSLLVSVGIDLAPQVEQLLAESLNAPAIHFATNALRKALSPRRWLCVNIGMDGLFWLMIAHPEEAERMSWLRQECVRTGVPIWQPRLLSEGVYLVLSGG